MGGVVHEGKGGDFLGDDSFFVDGLCFEPQSAEKTVLSDVGFSLDILKKGIFMESSVRTVLGKLPF